ncbi:MULTISPECIES: anti-sigma factor [Mycolicibacterium]|uniref:anti-sigma factor n=1 Tax=Mycolicibacterium TaxID=1866885 RepID=UPI0007EA406A|nr:anti-sigma factor [Mycolicibacterium fortuitum]MCA4756423.1 anti-sigma factor [Mycolicibacterium fortuitum]OBA96881.1 anti-sigma factor [Mycolicibacterium fortuitum]OBB46490.1 anti-sigma factor [Mycolicibacterium fortuitum]OBB57467.1 anti-sigma factor [Mycolicibacterium fortuitum]OBF87652.1 anti-sigma factor [Mycolicibacterium fortuitum]
MTEPLDSELLDLATPYALHAISDSERADIEQRLAAASPAVVAQFTTEVRDVRETMARLAGSTALDPPPQLREQLLAAVSMPELRPRPTARWRTIGLAAAAAVVIALAGVGIGFALRPSPQPTTAEQIFAAPDVRTVSGAIPTGGTATVVFSRERNAGVLVMNGVTPPQTGTVYQMWLLQEGTATSAGTMDSAAVAPSTTAVLPDLGDASALAFSVEPGVGSTAPTTPIFAELPLQ